MIDLHNHLLPGLDDGARDLEESVQIARRFVEEGVIEVAVTPHLDPLHQRGATPDRIARVLEEVRGEVTSRQLDLGLHRGQEVFLTPEIVQLLKSGAALPLGRSTYVLVEVSLIALERPAYLDQTLFEMQLAGYRPILGHPERYPFIQREPAAAVELTARGVALQLTAPSLLGEYGSRVRRTSEQLLRLGAYALAASDRHHPGPARSLTTLRARLEKSFGPELSDVLLETNPKRVLGDLPLISCDPLPPRRRFSVTGMFRR